MLVGVTGTNGKTTTTHLIRSILEAAGHTVGLIGTIEYRIGDRVMPATHTTPESLELNQMLDSMVKSGCTAAVMEVSSHALSMSRVHAQQFGAAVFTNLTQDHLDYHGTMEGYFEAKKSLFTALSSASVAVSNADDPYGTRMTDGIAARILLYGTSAAADVTARQCRMDVHGSAITLVYRGMEIPISSSLTGRFNIANILAACSQPGLAWMLRPEHISAGIANLKAVRGRFEQVQSPRGWTAIVDYAHTPDALENCLATIREILPKNTRIITVFGCGGNRDAGKRPKMGRIASTLSDTTFVTSDNPRKEKPGDIIAQVMKGVVPGKEVRVEPDRRAAIRKALKAASAGDVVLVAGKGHEDYQVIGDEKIHFDDREEIETFIRGQA